MTIQIQYTKPYHTDFGTTKPKGYISIMERAKAEAIINAGYAVEFKDYDLQKAARTEYENMHRDKESQLLENKPPGIWQTIKTFFKI